MTLGGWIVMLVSVGCVTTLFFLCLWLVMTVPEQKEHLHGFDTQTPDKDEAP